MSLWARRLAFFGVQIVILAFLLHRFSSLPTPALLGAFKVAMAFGVVAVVLSLDRACARFGVRAARASARHLSGMLDGLGIGGLAGGRHPADDAHSGHQRCDDGHATPPQFRELTRLREPGANSLQYAGETLARLQAQTFPDIKTMVVTRPGLESFELTREIIRRMKWVEVAARPPANANAVGEIEARVMTPVIGFRDDVVIRLKGERDKTRIDIRSASPYGRARLRPQRRAGARPDEGAAHPPRPRRPPRTRAGRPAPQHQEEAFGTSSRSSDGGPAGHASCPISIIRSTWASTDARAAFTRRESSPR